MLFKRTLLAATVASLPLVAHADNASLSPVVVTGARDGAPAVGAMALHPSILPALRSATSDTASLLRDVPGVSLYGAGGASSLPSIRGLADNRVRIQVDGMDLIASCPNHMNPPLSYIDPTNVAAMRVYAGIAPVSVGGDAIGGAIIAQSPAPTFAQPGQGRLAQGEVGAFVRSNANARGGNLAATYATEAFSLHFGGATAQSDNYRAGGDFKTSTATGRLDHVLSLDEVGSTAYETRNQSLGLAWRGGAHLFEAKLGWQDVPFQLYPNQRMDMLENSAQRLNLRYLGQKGWGTLEARAWHENVDHFMDFGADKRFWYGAASGGAAAINGRPCAPLGPTCAAGMPMHTVSKTSGVALKADVDLSDNDLLRLGGEVQRYRLDDWWPASGGGMWPHPFLNINDGERDRTALFGEWERRSGPQWLTLAGLRYEQVRMNAGPVHGYNRNTFPTHPVPAGPANQDRDAALFNNADRSKTDHNWNLAVLARYTPSATQDIEFGFAHKTRSPSLYERYTWSTWQMAALMVNWFGDGNGYIGNLDLKPERANTVSATFGWHAADRAWWLKATPYYTRVSNYIDAVQWNAATNAPRTVPLTNQFTTLKFMNQSARLYGIDVSGQMPLAQTAMGDFGVKGVLGYTNGKNLSTGDRLYNIMPLNARLTLTHRHGRWDNAIELVMAQAKERVSAARNEIRTPGYGLVHLRGSYSWQQVRIDFGVENLFDKLYHLPLGGAYQGQGTTMSTAAASSPGWGVAVPGMGRSVYVGMNVKF